MSVCMSVHFSHFNSLINLHVINMYFKHFYNELLCMFVRTLITQLLINAIYVDRIKTNMSDVLFYNKLFNCPTLSNYYCFWYYYKIYINNIDKWKNLIISGRFRNRTRKLYRSTFLYLSSYKSSNKRTIVKDQ